MLPYASLQEAEAAVGGGRALTAAEALWFRYTAAVPDARLFNLNVALVFIIFHVGSFPTLLLDLLARSSLPSLRRFKLQPSSFNPPSSLLRSYATIMLTYLAVVAPLVCLSHPVFKFVGVRTSLPLPSMWEILVQIVVYMMVEDYINYWCHRGLHTKWAYKNIHYKHHELRTPTSICASYTHWLEMIIVTIPSFVGPTIVPGHIVTVWLWLALRQLLLLDFHSGFDFWWAPTKLIPFFITPEHHDQHHFFCGKSQANLGSIFTYCDYVYGTYKDYGYKKRIAGLKKEH